MPAPTSMHNVLVVEDDDTVRRLLIGYLGEQVSVNVDGARDGVEALHRLSSTRYAVIVLDVMMPKMSGVDLLDSLQAMTSDPSIQHIDKVPAVIVITAAPPGVLPDDLFAHRFPGVVHALFRKPLDVIALAKCVAEYAG